MLNTFFDWLQYGWGTAQTADGASYSLMLQSSLNFWGILEATHLLTLMLFFGSIVVVDLRLLGVSFAEFPVSTIERRLLPLTVTAMIIVMLSGALLFLAKPEAYWHSLMFRTKLVLLAVAIANVAVFHKLVEKNKDAWDTAATTPGKAKLAAIVSLASWVAVMSCGRFIGYDWFNCDKPQPAWINAAQDCAASRMGAEFLASTISQGEE